MTEFYFVKWQLTLAVEYFWEIHESLPEVNASLVQKNPKKQKKTLPKPKTNQPNKKN